MRNLNKFEQAADDMQRRSRTKPQGRPLIEDVDVRMTLSDKHLLLSAMLLALFVCFLIAIHK